MWVSLNLPRVEARDLRPEVPPEQTLVISSGHKASFLMLDVSGRVSETCLITRILPASMHCTAKLLRLSFKAAKLTALACPFLFTSLQMCSGRRLPAWHTRRWP